MKFNTVIGYNNYEVSQCGLVYRKEYVIKKKLKQGITDVVMKRILMKIHIDRRGYNRVHLANGKKHTLVLLHRIVALAHIPNPENLPQVNHKDGNKNNNNVNNLEWITLIENMRHSWEIGLRKMGAGEKHPTAKLTNEQVIDIFKSSLTKTELAKKYNVKHTTIHYIKIGRNWSSVTKDIVV